MTEPTDEHRRLAREWEEALTNGEMMRLQGDDWEFGFQHACAHGIAIGESRGNELLQEALGCLDELLYFHPNPCELNRRGFCDNHWKEKPCSVAAAKEFGDRARAHLKGDGND